MTFVLVHGMSHGAWCWDALRARLERDGHHVVAADLPGHGRRAHERRRASVATYAQVVADAMMLDGVHDGVVVGHSMGGIVIPKVAELVPARVRHLVVLAAVVLRDGESVLGTHLPPAMRQVMRGLASTGGGAVQYPAALESARWMSDLAPGDPRVVEALPRITPQPFRPCTQRLDVKRFWALEVPRTYIRCVQDQAVTPAMAARYAARLGVTPIDMDCAHNPMMSQPDALAAILEKI